MLEQKDSEIAGYVQQLFNDTTVLGFVSQTVADDLEKS